MSQPTLLIADNDPDFVNITAQYFELAGYKVLRAYGFDQASQTLNQSLVHVAIIDVRLNDDTDAKDQTGLTLAKKYGTQLAKIMLTRYPTWEIARDALVSEAGEAPIACSFLDKREGLPRLKIGVENALTKYVRVNFTLRMLSGISNPLSILAHLQPDTAYTELAIRADELTDLLRRVFYHYDQLRLDRILWQTDGRVALVVYAFKNGNSEAFVLVCGDLAQVSDEANRFRALIPQPPNEGSTWLGESMSAQTFHFAANAYKLGEAKLENMRSLDEIYVNEPIKILRQTLESLYQNTLLAWHNGLPILHETQTLTEWYTKHFGLLERDKLTEHSYTIAKRSATLGHATLILSARQLKIEDSRDTQYYLNPIIALDLLSQLNLPSLFINAPGTMTGQRILVAEDGTPYLTDFSGAGQAPLHWNLVALEAEMRYGWGNVAHLQRLHELEKILTSANDFSRFDVNDAEPELRKLLGAIKLVRGFVVSAQITGRNLAAYQLGIYFHALRCIANFDPTLPYTSNELAQFTHALISAAMLATQLLQMQAKPTSELKATQPGLLIDHPNRKVWRDGVALPLPKQRYELLHYLYQRAGQLCTHAELYQHIWQSSFDETNKNHTDQLNITIKRLRENIEYVPESPRFLRNQRGAGFVLVRNPDT